jgi:regulator of replication initiation timing
MKRKGAPAKEGKCPRDAPKDQKCDNCRLTKGACQFAARIAAANATLSPGEPSTSERSRPQAAADSDMDDAEPRPSRERKAPERFEVDDIRPSRASGQRLSKSTCCSCSEPTTSDESAAPKPKFTGPMDKYLSDKRVEAAVNRAVKSITDNPADLERELRDFAQTGEDWRQKSMTLEQENEAIRKKLDKVTKELEKVKKEAAREIGNFNDAEDHKAILKAIVGNGYAHDESGRRLLRMHAAAIVEKIQATAKGMSSRTFCSTRRSSSARLTTRSPRASRLSRSMSRTSSCATFSFLRCLSSPTFFSYEPRTARKSCSCSLERAGIFTTARPCHGMLVSSRQRDE